MKISKTEHEQLIKWGVKFFTLGYNACLEAIQENGPMSLLFKERAVCDYINEIETDNKKTQQTITTYSCGCKASGDNVASHCPQHNCR
jgi:hypothetical protein